MPEELKQLKSVSEEMKKVCQEYLEEAEKLVIFDIKRQCFEIFIQDLVKLPKEQVVFTHDFDIQAQLSNRLVGFDNAIIVYKDIVEKNEPEFDLFKLLENLAVQRITFVRRMNRVYLHEQANFIDELSEVPNWTRTGSAISRNTLFSMANWLCFKVSKDNGLLTFSINHETIGKMHAQIYALEAHQRFSGHVAGAPINSFDPAVFGVVASMIFFGARELGVLPK